MSGCRVAGALQSRADLGRAKRAHRAVAVAGTRRQSQTVAEQAVLVGARATQGHVSCISSSWRGGVFISTVSTQRLWAQVKVWGDDRVVGRGSQPSQVKRQAPPRLSPSQLSRALTGHTASHIPPSPRCSQLLLCILNRRTRPGAVSHPLDFRWRHSGDGTLLHPPTPARTRTATIATTTTPTTAITTPGNYHDDHDTPRAARP
jgi:hypothetical protein